MVNANQYLARVVSAIEQVKLARRTLVDFAKAPDAVSKFIAEETTELREVLGRLADRAAPEDAVKRRNELFERYVEGRHQSLSTQLVDVENRLNQNEVILLAALFENQMKQIHREVLRQDPSALKSDRTVPLGKLIAEGRDVIVEDEIEREVQALDRKSVADRAKYFRERLKIDWFGDTAVPLVERVLTLRNDLLHENPDMLVSTNDVEYARFVALAVPMYCCLRAADRFPSAFPGWIKSPAGGSVQHGA